MGKMPPTQTGPKASPMPVPTEQPSQKLAMPAQVKVKKREQEEKTEGEKIIPEEVKETPLVEKIPPKGTTDQIQEESKLEKDKTSAPQEKKPTPDDKKPLVEEKKPPLEETKPTLKDKRPALEDKKLPPGAKTSALEEEQKYDLLKTQVQIAKEKPEGRVAPEAVQEKKQPLTKMEDLPSGAPQSLSKKDDGMTQKIKEQLQATCSAKPDQMEPRKEKTVSYVFFLTLQIYPYNLLMST